MPSRASTAAALPLGDERYDRSAQTAAGARESGESARIGHDLSRFDNRRTVRQAQDEESQARPARRRKAAVKPRVDLFTLLCSAAGVVIATALIFSYVNLTVLNDQLKKSKDELLAMENQGVLLKTEYESRYDLNEIETYATQNLGMVKMGRTQIEYVEIPNPDVIRKVTPEENRSLAYVVANFVKSFNAVLEYLEN